MAKEVQTIGLIRRGNRILLGMKKRGWGAGRWNGFGGKAQAGETTEQTLIREVAEESGVKVLKFKEMGIINFHFEDKPLQPEVHIFEITKYSGKPTETEEMKPKWFDISAMPYDEMWPADRKWFPAFLAKKKFSGDVYFKDDNSERTVSLEVQPDTETKVKIMTLAWIVEDGKILLGKLKRGIAEGKYNGFGGKLEAGETPEEAMIREFREECCVDVLEYEKIAVQRFFYLETNTIMESHLYRVLNYKGKPTETEEMVPEWFSFDKIPYDIMWPDDRIWMPLYLQNKKFTGNFIFKDYSEILSYKIDLIEDGAINYALPGIVPCEIKADYLSAS